MCKMQLNSPFLIHTQMKTHLYVSLTTKAEGTCKRNTVDICYFTIQQAYVMHRNN